ncbi:MAG: hypothetical protein KF860_17620, partial [Cyclobacteriaceae bacterium]|nr:hypothetical protein [Cyclobacteriaceae bacterium]
MKADNFALGKRFWLTIISFLVIAYAALSQNCDNINISATSTTFCLGASITYTADYYPQGGTVTYLWTVEGGYPSSGSGSSIIIFWDEDGGDVSLTVTEEFCEPGYPNPDCYQYCYEGYKSAGPTFIPFASPASSTTFCEGGSVTINSNTGTGFSYQWNKAGVGVVGTGSSYTATQGGGYSVTVSKNGCTRESNNVIVNVLPLPPQASISQITSDLIPGNTILKASGSSNYQWRMGGVDIEGANNELFNPAVPGNYSVASIIGICENLSASISFAGSSNNYNYLSSNVFTIPGLQSEAQLLDQTVGSGVVQQSISYLNNLGKPIQSIQTKASPGGRDIIQVTRYDALGRADKTYLPFTATPASSGGKFSVSALTATYTSSDQYKFYNDISPFSETKVANDPFAFATQKYEPSPLGRVKQLGSIGEDFQPVTGAYKTLAYGTNVANEVRNWVISGSLPAGTGAWTASLLSMQSVTNEEGVESQVFTTRDGLKILDRIKDGANWAETYYVYDNRQNLRFMLPPELIRILKAASNYSPSIDQINRWAYQTVYDNRDRPIETKTPGIDWSYAVYDSRDRVILTQDGNQRVVNQWSYTKYDELNRPVVSGVYSPGSAISRASMQITIDGQNGGLGYNNFIGTPPDYNVADYYLSAYEGINEYIASNSITLQPGFTFTAGTTAPSFRAVVIPDSGGSNSDSVFPTTNDHALVVTYYDTYTGCGFCELPAYQFVNESWGGITSNEPFAKSSQVLGKAVAGRVRILDTDDWLNSVSYYDRNGAVIQTIGSDHLGGTSRSSTLSDFSGKVLAALNTYSIPGVDINSIRRRFTYDHAGRLLKTYHQLSGQPEVILNEYHYNELGELIDKKIHSVNSSPYLQSIDYEYAIQGRLSKMNMDEDTSDPAPDFFGMEFGYHNPITGLSTERSDGLISGIKWKEDMSSKEKGYGFDYNDFGWLTSSTFKINNTLLGGWGVQSGSLNEDGLTYDYNGNVKSLNRTTRHFDEVNSNYVTATMDQLEYKYGANAGEDNGNQLQYVKELSTSDVKDDGFKDGGANTFASPDYTYDINGNLTSDKNKGITSISYNFLNLVDTVVFDDDSYLRYMYDAGGTKLSQAYYNDLDELQSKTDYVGEFVLVDGNLELIHHEEGRIVGPDFVNLVPDPTRDANGLEGFSENGTVTLSAEFIGGQNYVKALCNQSSGTSGVFPIGNTYNVKPGENYRFKVLGYQSVGTTASLYVKSNTGDLIWPGLTLPVGAGNEDYVTSDFTIPAGVTQIELGIRWNGPAVGNTFFINQVKLYHIDFEYQYYLADQVGSPRVVLQTTPATLTFVATMETENHAVENEEWLNLNQSQYVPMLPVNAGGNEAIQMDSSYRIGPSRSFKVFPEDVVDASVLAYYASASGYTEAAVGVMANALQTSLLGGISVIDGGIATAYSTANNTDIALSPFQGSNKPSAFLNYILFDQDYMPLKAKSFAVGNSPNVQHTVQFDAPLMAEELGYMFVYLSYDNASTQPVYFDNLKVTYTESPVVQVNNYY